MLFSSPLLMSVSFLEGFLGADLGKLLSSGRLFDDQAEAEKEQARKEERKKERKGRK